MSNVKRFLEDAASMAGTDIDSLLTRVLHVDDGVVSDFAESMTPEPRALLMRLDRELRLRNPGLHYVVRKMFLGYRREGATTTPLGERSQIFASVLRHGTRLEVVIPVGAESITLADNARDLRGTGHHGVGDVKVTLASESEVDDFLAEFDHWLRTPSTS